MKRNIGQSLIEDNFLEQEKFDEIQLIVNPMEDNTNPFSSSSFPWYFRYKYYTNLERDQSYIGLKDEDESLASGFA